MDNHYLRPTTIFKQFQKTGIVTILKLKKMVLGDATGLGKTIQMFGAFTYYKTKFPNAKMLLLTDKSLVHQVEAEFHKFFHSLKTANIYEMERTERYKVYEDWLLGDTDILVGNYGSFRDDVLGATSIRLSLQHQPTCEKGYKSPAKGYKGKFGVLKITKKGKLTYTANADLITHSTLGLGKHKQEMYDHFAIQTLEGKEEAVYASIKRLEEGKRRYVVQLHNADGSHSHRTTSSPFVDYLEEANRVEVLPLYSAFDEAAIFKETDSRTHLMGKYLARHSSRCVPTTATVTKGELWETYNIFKCMGLELMPKQQFKDKFCVYEPNYSVKPRIMKGNKVYPMELVGYKNVSEFRKVIAPYYLGRAKKDVASELPAFGTKRIEVEECSGVKAALQELHTAAYLAERPASVNQMRSALLTPQLYCEELPKDYLSATAKEFIRRLKVGFSGEKIVVYVDLKQPLDILCNILPQHLPKHYKNQLKITGDVSDREAVKQLFNTSPDHNILWINSAGLKGLNLQISGDMFPLMPPFTGGDYIQMAGRISRIGSEHAAFTLHRIVQRDSVATDNEIIIQSRLRLIWELTPNSVDEGLIESYFNDKCIVGEFNEDKFIIDGFENRKGRYLKKQIEI
jgi:VCBS repeat-containing protein